MKIRDFIGATARAAGERGLEKERRGFMLQGVRQAMKSSAVLARMASGIADTMTFHDREVESWIEPGTSASGRFDVCDLRMWLEIAEEAGIEAIPAKEVARLSEDELSALLGPASLDEDLRRKLMAGLAHGVLSENDDEAAEKIFDLVESVTADPEKMGALYHQASAKMESALDEVPSSWMVRTHVAGSNNLKALVGCGLMQKGDDTAVVQKDFELGAGWVRVGNRRIIDYSDPRFIELSPGHKPETVYLARPWAQPGRFHEGEDLHRANTPLAGPGVWPAEWRAFVRAGVVTGVANYYGWTGEGATPENAWNAIEVAAKAQAMANTAEARGLVGVFMQHELIRNGRNTAAIAYLDAFYPPDRLNATLDFLEGEEGLLFLEGGPGAGHPCAFAGQGMNRAEERMMPVCEGVAYTMMPHINLAEPETWIEGDPEGAIEDWGTAAARAAQHAPLSPEALQFLAGMGVDVTPSEEPDFG